MSANDTTPGMTLHPNNQLPMEQLFGNSEQLSYFLIKGKTFLITFLSRGSDKAPFPSHSTQYSDMWTIVFHTLLVCVVRFTNSSFNYSLSPIACVQTYKHYTSVCRLLTNNQKHSFFCSYSDFI